MQIESIVLDIHSVPIARQKINSHRSNQSERRGE